MTTSNAKHVDFRFKYICHHKQEGIVIRRFVKSHDMMARILMKALLAPKMKMQEMIKLKAIKNENKEDCVAKQPQGNFRLS